MASEKRGATAAVRSACAGVAQGCAEVAGDAAATARDAHATATRRTGPTLRQPDRRCPVPPPASALDLLTVLVADDDADMRRYLRGCLLAFGVAYVLEAADGHEALRLAPEADLVVSDVRMPGLDGASLCEALRADVRTRTLPVLLISGETCGPPCGDGFLPKPFNAATLRGEVERMLARLR